MYMKRRLPYSTYFDKVHGGWLGKCIGGTVGARMENNKDLMAFTYENVFPDKIPPNDDLDIQLLWLDVLEKKGSNITSHDLAEAWLKAVWYAPNEYGYFVKNYRLGIAPPMSGVFNNHFFKESMGCPIRSEIWGFTCPGTPGLASAYAYKDGTLDHDLLSVYAEQFFAAIESEAFFCESLLELIDLGLGFVPLDTDLYRCVRSVIQQFESGVTWQEARRKLLQRFSSPDASYCVQNIGLTVLALLFGKGDFTETMLIAVNSGYDTDCTAATAGAILGQMMGASRIPQHWLQRMGEDYIIGIHLERPSLKIYDLATDTCQAGLSLVRDGLLLTDIYDIPDDVASSLPEPLGDPLQSIDIIYTGLPSIGVDSPAEVKVTLRNHSPRIQNGTLVVETSDLLSVNIAQMSLSVAENGGLLEFPLVFRVNDHAKELPVRNMITLRWVEDHSTIASHSFGLSGASRVKVIGPFWDTYDSVSYAESPFLNRMPDGRYHFNNFINPDKAYIDESFVDVDEADGIWVDFHEDKLTLNELFPHRGQSCLYLIHDVVSPDVRDVLLNVGNNDSFTCWFNGEFLVKTKEHTMWMPYNTEILIRLNKGVNRLIFKVIRTDSHFEFSFGFRGDNSLIQMPANYPSIVSHWFVDLGSKIENR